MFTLAGSAVFLFSILSDVSNIFEAILNIIAFSVHLLTYLSITTSKVLLYDFESYMETLFY